MRESAVITKARNAGMVLLGHAALSEAADHRALTNFSDGYSTRGRQVSRLYIFEPPPLALQLNQFLLSLPLNSKPAKKDC